jgi:osmotically inducible lipoprotein OsmB
MNFHASKTFFAVIAALVLCSACSTPPTRQDIGIVGGAVAGGVIGSVLTGGSTVGTAAGAAGGALVGRQIANTLPASTNSGKKQ